MSAQAHPEIDTLLIGPYLWVITRADDFVEYSCETDLESESWTYNTLLCRPRRTSHIHRIDGVRQS